MKQQIFILLTLIFMVSCTSKTIYKKPDNLIERDQMIKIWTDIYIARGARSVQTIDKKNNINYLPLVFEKYKIDSTQFSESNLFYTSKIDDYQKIFEEVNRRLKEKKKIYQPETEMDSIINETRELVK